MQPLSNTTSQFIWFIERIGRGLTCGIILIACIGACTIRGYSTAHAENAIDITCKELLNKLSTAKNGGSIEELLRECQGRSVRWKGKVVSVEESLWGREVTLECDSQAELDKIRVFFDGASQSTQILTEGQIHFTGEIEGYDERTGLSVRNGKLDNSKKELQEDQHASDSLDASRRKSVTVTPSSESPKEASFSRGPGTAGSQMRSSHDKWFVILGSFPKANRKDAEERLIRARSKGIRSFIIETDDYPGFRHGLLAVVSGPYPSKEAAEGEKRATQRFIPDSYVKAGW